MKLKLIIIPVLLLIFSNSLFAQMFWNQTCSFAGSSSSYISVPNSVSVNITGSFSVEAWVNPSSLSGASKGIISKGSALGTSLRYGVRLNTNGTLSFSTSGATRLVSRLSTALQINKWTHITCTYNSATSEYKIYLNGGLDTSSIVAGSSPPSNTDSLFIGISGSSTPYQGQLDELRLWNRALTSLEIAGRWRSTIATSDAPYNGLVLSMTFQEENSTGVDFTARDFSGNSNHGNVRSVTGIDQSNSPYLTIHPNESVELNGSGSYLVAQDTAAFDATNAITIECWVYPRSLSASTFVAKGTSFTYFLGWNGAKLQARINNVNLQLGSPPPLVINQWTHLAFRYVSSGQYQLFMNGNPLFAGFENAGVINATSDSLYIGGGPGALQDLNGFIDEVRITKDHSKTRKNILDGINISVDDANDPLPLLTNVSYNLDGSLVDNGNEGGTKLRLIGGAKFSHPATTGNPVSPTARPESNLFSEGYYMSHIVKNIPFSGSAGVTYDTININESLSINDLNVFVALNHQVTSQLDIVLISPSGDSVRIFNHTGTNNLDGSIAAVFDDQSDSSITDSRFTTYSPQFKPSNSLNAVFSGENSSGKWILKINDDNEGETGKLYAWGIQLNNQTESKINLDVSAFIQGFYNASSNQMQSDSIKVVAHDFSTLVPLDSSYAIIDGNGLMKVSLSRVLIEKLFYVELDHRNSIETWSASFVNINDDYLTFDFTDHPSRAFGENQIQIDSSPERFAFYSGDVNKDDIVDLSDITAVFNDANAFVSGYVVTDVTGDNFVDLSDLTLVFNNSNNFVTAIIPD